MNRFIGAALDNLPWRQVVEKLVKRADLTMDTPVGDGQSLGHTHVNLFTLPVSDAQNPCRLVTIALITDKKIDVSVLGAGASIKTPMDTNQPHVGDDIALARALRSIKRVLDRKPLGV